MNSQIKRLICFNSLAIIFIDIQIASFIANGILFRMAPGLFWYSTFTVFA